MGGSGREQADKNNAFRMHSPLDDSSNARISHSHIARSKSSGTAPSARKIQVPKWQQLMPSNRNMTPVIRTPTHKCTPYAEVEQHGHVMLASPRPPGSAGDCPLSHLKLSSTPLSECPSSNGTTSASTASTSHTAAWPPGRRASVGVVKIQRTQYRHICDISSSHIGKRKKDTNASTKKPTGTHTHRHSPSLCKLHWSWLGPHMGTALDTPLTEGGAYLIRSVGSMRPKHDQPQRFAGRGASKPRLALVAIGVLDQAVQIASQKKTRRGGRQRGPQPETRAAPPRLASRAARLNRIVQVWLCSSASTGQCVCCSGFTC